MANTTKIKVVTKTPGKHIEYAISGEKKITFGDDELTVNLASRERDHEVVLDICIDEENGVVIGTGGKAQKFAAQIIIPARSYDTVKDTTQKDEAGTPLEIMVPADFNMSLCTLVLWGLED